MILIGKCVLLMSNVKAIQLQNHLKFEYDDIIPYYYAALPNMSIL